MTDSNLFNLVLKILGTSIPLLGLILDKTNDSHPEIFHTNKNLIQYKIKY